jgi:deazaflavin-dependent oxidoreductase (nitroreductase family)
MSAFRRVGTTLMKGGLAAFVWVYRRTKGRLAGSIRGTPVLLLTTTGRRSGARRTRPVGFLPENDGFVVCGSNGGSDHSPAWALNLRALPTADVQVGARTLAVTATEVTGPEYEPLWQRYIAAYPGFAGYRLKTQRHLPLFILRAGPGVPPLP